ncbi:MAG: DUF3048 domain-containing protein [Oscillospiraceae bacterium]|nr:DUF3048 domain-containing protein [Oscillospiraceae bacterium]
MKKFLSLVLAALTMASLLTGCISAPGGDESQTPAEPTPTPRIYAPNPFTGYKKTADYIDQRPVAIMINNISAARPQSGLSQASVLFESKVEGGITRFMGIFEDYTTLADVGPVRSGRDQFLQWAMPWQALYMHIGRSGITQTYIDTNNYNELDVDGQYKNFIYRRERPGKALEHTAYTNAEQITKLVEKYEYDMDKTYTAPLFNFVDYDENGGVRELNGEAVQTINIVHSETYRTYFEYDEATMEYKMSMYNGSKGVREATIDENTGEQIGFENVFVAFADISKYPYPGGGKGDPNYQKVDLTYGGVGYYFSNGKVEQIRWFKGAPTEALRFTDMDENPLQVNCGKSYIGFVDLDEYERFEYAAPEVEIVEEEIDPSQVVETETEFE